MLKSMKWHTPLSAAALACFIAWSPVQAHTPDLGTAPPQAAVSHSLDLSIDLLPSDKLQLAQLDRRTGETLQDLKRDPARAALLSTLYPGLGQFYIGNDNSRSLWIMGGGTLVIAGSLVGYGLLSGRPEEASGLGNTLITAVLLGYHLWNIRDAFVQATEYNLMLESENRFSLLPELRLSPRQDTLVLAWQFAL